MQGLTFVAPFLGILGLIIAYVIYLYVKKQPNGTPLMEELEGMIHSGAMAFLKREYSVLILLIIVVALAVIALLGQQVENAFETFSAMFSEQQSN